MSMKVDSPGFYIEMRIYCYTLVCLSVRNFLSHLFTAAINRKCLKFLYTDSLFRLAIWWEGCQLPVDSAYFVYSHQSGGIASEILAHINLVSSI